MITPTTWVSTKLGEVVEVMDHLRLPVSARERQNREAKFPYYGATGQVGWIDQYRQDGEFVLLGEDGAPFFNPYKPKAYIVRGKCWVNNHAHILKGLDGIILNRFLLHNLNFIDYRGFANGTTRLKLTQASMLKLPLVLPPFAEQIRISDEIDNLFSLIDSSITLLRRIKSNLKRYRASVLQAAVEGRLTAEWRKQNPPSVSGVELLERLLKERRAKWEENQLKKYAEQGKTPPRNWKEKYPEPVKPDTNGLPELPEGWAWGRLDSLASIKGGITVDSKRKDTTARSVAYLRVANVQRGYLNLSEIKYIQAPEADIHELCLECDDIFFNEGGDRDKLGRGWIWEGQLEECIHQNHVFRARPYSKDLSSKIISWWGNTFGKNYFLREGKQTTNLASINLSKLGALPIPIPPKCEQAQIVTEIETRLFTSDAAENTIDNALKRAERLRQSILKRAFEGRLVPQDPNDEPASVLLERIRAERAAQAATVKPARAQRKAKGHAG